MLQPVVDCFCLIENSWVSETISLAKLLNLVLGLTDLLLGLGDLFTEALCRLGVFDQFQLLVYLPYLAVFLDLILFYNHASVDILQN
jgi:hypothetical protein